MTPNPNPSPELREAIARIVYRWLPRIRSFEDAKSGELAEAYRHADEVIAALSPQTPPPLQDRLPPTENGYKTDAGGENDYAQTLPAPGEVPQGMKPWTGGDGAPDDWDGGPVLRADGHTEHSDDITRQQWKSPIPRCKWNIVAYTPARSMVEVRRNPDDQDWGNCPRCKTGSLDTGFECNACGFDALPLVHLRDACEQRGDRMHPSGLYEGEIGNPIRVPATAALSPQTPPAPGEVEQPTDTDVAEALRHGFGDRIANQVLADESADRFAGWSTIDLAAQCRMQAREGLDPDYEKFMHALSDRLLAFASRDDVSC